MDEAVHEKRGNFSCQRAKIVITDRCGNRVEIHRRPVRACYRRANRSRSVSLACLGLQDQASMARYCGPITTASCAPRHVQHESARICRERTAQAINQRRSDSILGRGRPRLRHRRYISESYFAFSYLSVTVCAFNTPDTVLACTSHVC